MKGRLAYDRGYDQPAALAPVWLAPPGSASGVLLYAIVDSGADCTVVPAAVARAAALPVVDEVWVEGVGSAARRVTVYAAHLDLFGHASLVRLLALGEEAILGRDLLNRVRVVLDGPRLELSWRATP